MWKTRTILLAAFFGVLSATVAISSPTVLSQRSVSPPVAPQQTFDAVSIKPNKSGDEGGMTRPPLGGRFVATNVTAETVITIAYGTFLKPPKLIGAPSWITSEHFDIEANAVGNASMDEMRPMLRAMLADRFKLAVHHETRQLPQYTLVLVKEGKLGPKLVPHADDSKCADISATGSPGPPRPGEIPPTPCGGFVVGPAQGGMHLVARKVTIDALAGPLTRWVDRTVVDGTALTGVYDVELNFTPLQTPFAPGPGGPPISPPDSNAPPIIFTALQEQLGLKLKRGTAPADVLVIDHVEEPSPN